MTDREKVIEQIHDAIDYGVCVELFLNILDLLEEQEAEIRQLRLALDIAKGTCKGIVAGGR